MPAPGEPEHDSKHDYATSYFGVRLKAPMETDEQRSFRELLEDAIRFLRNPGPLSPPSERAEFELLRPRRGAPVAPLPILYQLTAAFREDAVMGRRDAPRRRGADLAQWYYEDVAYSFGLDRGPRFQRYARLFVDGLERLWWSGEPGVIVRFESVESMWAPELQRLKAGRERERCAKALAGLLEVSWGLGMVHPTADELRVVAVPSVSVLSAKLFGLKTSIPGFDDLTGGGLILKSMDQAEEGTLRPRGTLGVIRGRFSSGKSTLAIQLAFEMARKGGVGVLMLLEQPVDEVLAQAHHFGWLSAPQDPAFDVIHDDGVYGGEHRSGSGMSHFVRLLREAKASRKGLLFLHWPEDASLSRFEETLDGFLDIAEFVPSGTRPTGPSGEQRQGGAEPREINLRFIVVDPLDAVQLTAIGPGADEPHRVRNRAAQLLHGMTSQGLTLWVTMKERLETMGPTTGYEFLPDIGDVVIRQAVTAAGAPRSHESILRPTLRLFEFEKVRTQPVRQGVHPFEIQDGAGVRIYPSGGEPSHLRSWVPAWSPRQPENAFTLGHSSLDLILGTDGVREGSVTTFMGPTGCAKTELGLLYLLNHSEPGKCLFVAFRDRAASVGDILNGPVGIQLRAGPGGEPEGRLDMLPLEVQERPPRLVEWGRKALAAAQRRDAAKRKRSRKKSTRKDPGAVSVSKLLNLGPKSTAWLEQVGIRTRADLERVGSVKAWLKVREAGLETSLNLLWALEGALLDLRWDRLPPAVKDNLRQRAGLKRQRRR